MSVEVHPAAVPFEKTFLKHHIPDQLGWTNDRVLGDVLALDELHKGVLRRAVSVADNADFETVDRRLAEVQRRLPDVLSFKDFFYEGWPDQQIYLPVPVFHVDTHRRYSELTDLLQKAEPGRGVVLLARSGAGKTVAQRKAFCDCFYSKQDADAPRDDNKPRLAGHLPCWVKLHGHLPEEHVIERLLWDTAGLESGHPVRDSVQAWLDCAPRLLLLFDLNVLGPEDRLQVADAIATFQATWAKHGHRCVVAYRSTVANDATMDRLRSEGDFDFYDMRPLLSEQAATYLANIRRYEQRVYQTLGVPWSERDVEGEVRHIGNLLKHVSGFGGQQDPLISTPLLMHFASLLDSEMLARVETLTDLYDAVVNLHLDREQVKYAKARRLPSGPAGKKLIRVAMTRTAFAMQALGGRTSLREEVFNSLMQNPKQDLEGKSWWPDDPFWHDSSYFDPKSALPGEADTRQASVELLQGLKEFSLLQRKGSGEVGFLHDSLIYYFAALGLCEYQGADMPLRTGGRPKEWFPKAVCRMQQDPQSWLPSVGFLGAMFREEAFLVLAREFVLAASTPETPQLLWRLYLGIEPSLPTKPPHRIRVLGEALQRDLHFFTRHPQALFQCLWNRCWWYDSPDAEQHYKKNRQCSQFPPWQQSGSRLFRLLEDWRENWEAKRGGSYWLRAVWPLPDEVGGHCSS